jgi:hypothetical protein
MSDWRLRHEPRGRRYVELIGVLASICDQFGFHLTDMKLDPPGVAVVSALSPYLARSEASVETPGSRSLSPVTLNVYDVHKGSVEVLAVCTEHLFDWQEPQLPNDLFFLVEGRPLFTTLASDREAYFSISEDQHASLVDALPWLRLRRLKPL